jgi:hypothetical protein
VQHNQSANSVSSKEIPIPCGELKIVQRLIFPNDKASSRRFVDILSSPWRISNFHSFFRFENIFPSNNYRKFFSLLAPLLDDDDRDSFVDHNHGRNTKQRNKSMKEKCS